MIWLPDMDLNHDKQIQSLLCYRYTTRQYLTKLDSRKLHWRFTATNEEQVNNVVFKKLILFELAQRDVLSFLQI